MGKEKIHIFVGVVRFSPASITSQSILSIFMLLLSQEEASRAWEPSKKSDALPDMGSLEREAALLFCCSAQSGNTVYKVLIFHTG